MDSQTKCRWVEKRKFAKNHLPSDQEQSGGTLEGRGLRNDIGKFNMGEKDNGPQTMERFCGGTHMCFKSTSLHASIEEEITEKYPLTSVR